MTINVIDKSETYLAGWNVKIGERGAKYFIAGWLDTTQREYRWWASEMTKLYGKSWRDEEAW